MSSDIIKIESCVMIMFCVLLVSLNIIHGTFIRLAVHSNNPSSKLLYIALYEYTTIYLSIFLLMDIFSSLFFSTVNNSAMNIFLMSFGAITFAFLLTVELVVEIAWL